MQLLCRRAYPGMCAAWTWCRASASVSATNSTLPVFLPLLLLFLSVASFAQETDNPRDRVYVFKSDQDCPPFEYVENNRLKGMNVEMLEIVAQLMDLNIRFDWGVWSDIRAELEAGKIDGLTGMMYSEDRRRYADFSASYNTISYALFVRQDSVVTNLEKAAGLTIAVQEGDHAHDYLLSIGFSGVIIPVPAAAEALKKLDAGACQGALIGRVHGLYLLNEMNLNSIMAGDTAIQLNQECCFAVSKGNEWLLAQLNEGLRVLKNNGQYNDIHQRWMGFDVSKKNQGRYLIYVYVGLTIILAIFIWAQILRRQVRRRTADLKRSEERYRSLVDKLPDGIAVLRDNEFLFANRAAAILFTGNGKMDLKGTSVLPYLHPEDRPAGLVHLSALPEPDAPLSDVRIVRPGSHEIRHAETAGIMID